MENHTQVGIIGGGQLCKMLIEAGIKWNIKFNVLESDSTTSICNQLANTCIRGSLNDPLCIQRLAKMSNVLTYEIENINVDELLELEKNGKKIIPSPQILQMIQDKSKQKKFMYENGIPTAQYDIFTGKVHLDKILQKYPEDKFVIKSCIGGYDGRGVEILNREDLLNSEYSELINNSCVFEEFIECKKELAVIVARDQFGNTLCYPVVEMKFHETNVLDYQICPAKINDKIEKTAKDIAQDTITKMNGIGIFAVEMFLTNNNEILVNEISPRPHNSGHYTIEACETSQYEQLLRIILGLPLGSITMTKPSITINLLGPDDYVGPYQLKNSKDLLALGNCHIHMYGKQPSKPGRKLGHITILDNSNDLLELKLQEVKKLAIIVPIYNIVPNEVSDYELKPIVGVIMGSISDKEVMQDSIDILELFQIPYEFRIVSAHRTPDTMFQYAKGAEDRGLKIIIAGAGGAAHLPGMTASLTNLPVIGVPVKSSTMSGLDSLYSIVQMPRGIPVATMAINGSKNAGLLATRILAIEDLSLKIKLNKYMKKMHDNAITSNDLLGN